MDMPSKLNGSAQMRQLPSLPSYSRPTELTIPAAQILTSMNGVISKI